MASAAMSPSKSALDAKLSKGNPGKLGFLIGGLVLIAGVMYAGYNLVTDLGDVKQTSIFPYLLLGLGLLGLSQPDRYYGCGG